MFQCLSQKRAKRSPILPGNVKGASLKALNPFKFEEQHQHLMVPQGFSDP